MALPRGFPIPVPNLSDLKRDHYQAEVEFDAEQGDHTSYYEEGL